MRKLLATLPVLFLCASAAATAGQDQAPPEVPPLPSSQAASAEASPPIVIHLDEAGQARVDGQPVDAVGQVDRVTGPGNNEHHQHDVKKTKIDKQPFEEGDAGKRGGVFYERVVNRILDDLVAACRPRWMQVEGAFNVRGGMSTVVSAEHPTPPQ